jgi:hypothetical protein
MNVAKLLQQARHAQEQLQRTLAGVEVEGSAGGGLVRVRLNGLKELRGVSIDAQALAGEEVGLLEDLVMAAWEDASRRLAEHTKQALAGMGLPAGLEGLL